MLKQPSGDAILTILSLVFGYLAQAAFTPSFPCCILLFCVGLVKIFSKKYKAAAVLLVINGAALFGVWQLVN